ncbi:hypothetical protein HCU66_03005 [Pseudomonas frederiksbergensis]|uniref:hypothetical protein n=1 Tax=Pseudomonas frederiksbergensis TaxID=104087 RepID=UPI00197FE6FD|nr:hypothetical protein [Pseudomonas frederiksbergensis]MBN3861187.1 hypothetical protein [Pseudomonas frederiksbergensis]
MIEMISRVRRQSITGVVEAAIEEIASDLLTPFFHNGETFNFSLSDVIGEVWSTDESERFINMCYHVPTLLTYEEQRIWETIKASKVFLWTDGIMETSWELEGGGRLDRLELGRWWSDLLGHVEAHKDSRTVVPFEPQF